MFVELNLLAQYGNAHVVSGFSSVAERDLSMPSLGFGLVFGGFAASLTAVRQGSYVEVANTQILNATISGSSAIEADQTLQKNHAHAKRCESDQPEEAPVHILYNQVPIPSASEAAKLISDLSEAQAQGAEEFDVKDEIRDFTMRFAALAYGRNGGERTQFSILATSANSDPRKWRLKSTVMADVAEEMELHMGQVADAIEIQIHGTGDSTKGAHVVFYLYRAVGGGAGVVVSFKGSTLNVNDWGHNVQVWNPEYLLSYDARRQQPQSQPQREAAVHQGFLKYKRTLDARMKRFWMQLPHIRHVLERWGAPLEHNLFDWLNKGKWEWCLVVGHSLGGAMAQIAAAEIALHSGKLPFLATVGAPTAGDDKFADTLNTFVLPGGGIRFYNSGDWVTSIGYLGVLGKHAGYDVEMQGRANVKFLSKILGSFGPEVREHLDKVSIHLNYTFPSRMLDGTTWLTLTLEFPSFNYAPEGYHEKPLQQSGLQVLLGSALRENDDPSPIDRRPAKPWRGREHD